MYRIVPFLLSLLGAEASLFGRSVPAKFRVPASEAVDFVNPLRRPLSATLMCLQVISRFRMMVMVGIVQTVIGDKYSIQER
jgi:hypothetical protein